MSYGVHIERSNTDDKLSLEEWLNYVSSDNEMHLIGKAAFTSAEGHTVQYEAPGLAEWTDPATGTKALFDYRRNGISVGNPSRETIVKMFSVAQALRGFVTGDEGERYDADGNPSSSRQ